MNHPEKQTTSNYLNYIPEKRTGDYIKIPDKYSIPYVISLPKKISPNIQLFPLIQNINKY